MKTFFCCLFAALAVLAAAAGGWFLWDENQQLRAERTTFASDRTKFTAERDQAQAELKQMTEAKESIGRSLVTTMKALDEAKANLAKLQKEKAAVEADLARERRQAREYREKAEAAITDAKTRAEKAEQAVKATADQTAKTLSGKAEDDHPQADDPLANVGTLKQLLDLTDKAPRRSGD